MNSHEIKGDLLTAQRRRTPRINCFGAFSFFSRLALVLVLAPALTPLSNSTIIDLLLITLKFTYLHLFGMHVLAYVYAIQDSLSCRHEKLPASFTYEGSVYFLLPLHVHSAMKSGKTWRGRNVTIHFKIGGGPVRGVSKRTLARFRAPEY